MRLSPPVPGRYEYELLREGGASTSTALIVETIAEAPGVVQQFQRFEFEGQRRLWVWNEASAVIDRTETASDARYGGDGYTCIWSEPPVMLAVPLEPGQRWTTSTSCTFTIDGREIRHDATEERAVLDRATATVGDREIEVVRIERETVLRSSGPQGFTQTVSSLDQFATSAGLLVHSDSTVVIEHDDGTQRRARAELALRDLEPR